MGHWIEDELEGIRVRAYALIGKHFPDLTLENVAIDLDFGFKDDAPEIVELQLRYADVIGTGRTNVQNFWHGGGNEQPFMTAEDLARLTLDDWESNGGCFDTVS